VSQELLAKAVEGSIKENTPAFKIGDTVNVSVRIVEGEKQRTQVFTGTVIRRKGGGIGETFTVRRIVNNEGVERVFPLHSPKVAGVEVVRSGKVRRAKLHYLRKRVGKATRLKEIRKPTKRELAAAKAHAEEKARAAEAQAQSESAGE
jgi:large subunit ribosomal protein L19